MSWYISMLCFRPFLLCVVWFVIYGEFTFDISFVIWLCSDLYIQYGGGDHLKTCIINRLAFSAVWLMVCGIFWVEEVIFYVILMVSLSCDLHIPNVRQLENENFKRLALFHRTHQKLSASQSVISYTTAKPIQKIRCYIKNQTISKQHTEWTVTKEH